MFSPLVLLYQFYIKNTYIIIKLLEIVVAFIEFVKNLLFYRKKAL